MFGRGGGSLPPPMSTTDEVKGWADRLLNKGSKVLATERSPRPGVLASNFVDQALFQEWRVQVLNLFERAVSRSDVYFEQAERVKSRCDVGNARALLGILRGFRDDVENGGLRRVEGLVSAEVFSDLLDQAEHLLTEGFVAPAAGLAGAVLERELRSLCSRESLKVKRSDGLSSMNSKLVAARVYSSIKSKKVELWTKIRNDADHGHFDDLDADDVRSMLKGVADFIDEHSS